MAKLNYTDIIAKHDELKKRKQKKKMLIECKALGGELEAEELYVDDLQKCLARMTEDGMAGVELFIFLSIPELQNNELLEAFKCKRNDGVSLVDRIFTKSEIFAIGEGLKKLNGLTGVDPDAIKIKFIEEDLKN